MYFFHDLYSEVRASWCSVVDIKVSLCLTIIIIIIDRFYIMLLFVLEQTHCAHVNCELLNLCVVVVLLLLHLRPSQFTGL